jgi:hypothetical protein
MVNHGIWTDDGWQEGARAGVDVASPVLGIVLIKRDKDIVRDFSHPGPDEGSEVPILPQGFIVVPAVRVCPVVFLPGIVARLVDVVLEADGESDVAARFVPSVLGLCDFETSLADLE